MNPTEYPSNKLSFIRIRRVVNDQNVHRTVYNYLSARRNRKPEAMTTELFIVTRVNQKLKCH